MRVRTAVLALLPCVSIFSLSQMQGCSATDAPASAPQKAAPSIEVMHWLTSTKDSAALSVIREAFAARGGTWRETPMPDAGNTGRAVAVSRILGGQPPDVFQFSLGSQLTELANQQLVAPVPGDSNDEHAIFSEVIEKAIRIRGTRFAVPIDVRGENWLFYNKAVLRNAGLQPPRSWPEILTAATLLKAQGKTALALGGQPWQERLLFNAVLLGVGGRDLYRRLYENRDSTALESDTMLRVFEIFGRLREYVDPGSPGRHWSPTTQMLVRGEAAFQVMGDWAKNEILAAGQQPGAEVGCELTPGEPPSYIMLVDVFAFSLTTDDSRRLGQHLFANAAQDPLVQADFARRLGAVPARADAPATGFDECSTLAMMVMRDPDSQLMDPALTLPGGLSGAIDDSISRYWNSPEQTPTRGVALLREAFRSY